MLFFKKTFLSLKNYTYPSNEDGGYEIPNRVFVGGLGQEVSINFIAFITKILLGADTAVSFTRLLFALFSCDVKIKHDPAWSSVVQIYCEAATC